MGKRARKKSLLGHPSSARSVTTRKTKRGKTISCCRWGPSKTQWAPSKTQWVHSRRMTKMTERLQRPKTPLKSKKRARKKVRKGLRERRRVTSRDQRAAISASIQTKSNQQATFHSVQEVRLFRILMSAARAVRAALQFNQIKTKVMVVART